VVGCERQVEHDRADERDADQHRRDDEHRAEQDDAVQHHLHRAGAPAARLLQVQRHHAEAAQAGLVAEQDQHADPDQQAADDAGDHRMQPLEADQRRRQFGEQRHQGDRDQAFEGEDEAHALEREGVERQVQADQQQTEIDAAGVVGQEGDPGDAAGDEPGLFVHRDAEGDHQRAGEQRLDVLEQGVAAVGRRPAGRIGLIWMIRHWGGDESACRGQALYASLLHAAPSSRRRLKQTVSNKRICGKLGHARRAMEAHPWKLLTPF
jgi:hypothetical protein